MGSSTGEMIPLQAFLYVELLAAAALAVWVMARKPRLGPKRISAALVLAVAVFVATRASVPVVPVLARLPAGDEVALIGYVLPSLFAMLLTAGWLLRALAEATHGSGGGGHRVTAPSRARR